MASSTGQPAAGQELTFTQAVQGAGSTTGNVEYAASYQSRKQPGRRFGPERASRSHQHADHGVGWDNARQRVRPVGHFRAGHPQRRAGRDLLGWLHARPPARVSISSTARRRAVFPSISLPALSNGLNWNTSNLYANGHDQRRARAFHSRPAGVGGHRLAGLGVAAAKAACRTDPTRLACNGTRLRRKDTALHDFRI